MVKLAFIVLAAICILDRTVEAVETRVLRERLPPLEDHQLGSQEFNTTRTPSPSQIFLSRRYFNHEIGKEEYAERWEMWEDHHLGKSTKWGLARNHKKPYLKSGSNLDASASVVLILSGITSIADVTQRLARFFFNEWNTRYGSRAGGDGDLISVGGLTPAISVRITLPASPTGTFDAASLQGPLQDMLSCLNNGNAQRVCLTADAGGGIMMTASYAKG
ncbi:hypothetical protein CBS101457_005666 [Exobasidium rhododendri]|nr:hypothetical protein CBS101457_005666 [Exobasidium rhododendri]